jgi:hypothetical protein
VTTDVADCKRSPALAVGFGCGQFPTHLGRRFGHGETGVRQSVCPDRRVFTGMIAPEAVERTRLHVVNFNSLCEQIKQGEIDNSWLSEIERRHNLFPDLDYRIYAEGCNGIKRT